MVVSVAAKERLLRREGDPVLLTVISLSSIENEPDGLNKSLNWSPFRNKVTKRV